MINILSNPAFAWSDPIYRHTVGIIIGSLFCVGALVFLLRHKNHYFVTSWASIKSWLVAAPLLLGFLGLPPPYPLIMLTLIAILGAKVFFQILGMYHRTWFVQVCYAGVIALFFCIRQSREDLYNLMPMIVLSGICLIPLIRNSYKDMIQYISLTLLAFIFMGWCFMHLGLILQFANGHFQLIYLIILTEFCDNTIIAMSRYIGSVQFVSRINPKRTLEATAMSIALTIFLAFTMRYLLPDNSEKYWLVSGLIAGFAGGLGDLVMTTIRRDLGIRYYGAFVIGRGDFLQRMDRLIFVAPIYYHVMTRIQHWDLPLLPWSN